MTIENLEYDVRYSERAKHPLLKVDLDGVEVIIPEGHSIDPNTVLRRKERWLQDKLAEQRELRKEIPDRSYDDGSVLYFLETPYQVKHEDRQNTTHDDNQLLLSQQRVNEEGAKHEVKRVLKRIFKDHAKRLVNDLADEHGLEYNKLYIRDQKTKWGSCSSKDNISLNWRLGFAPKSVIRYTAAHEIAHLKHMDHSPAFWNTVEQIHEDYREAKLWLNTHEHQLKLL
jgi:predicted metal-dependent hydrolase